MAGEPAAASRSVAAIRRVRDLLHRRRRAALAAAALLAAGVALARGVYTVDSAETAALLRFGRLVDDAVAPGLHLRLPAGADEAIPVATGGVARLAIGGRGSIALSPPSSSPLRTLLTGDTHLIEIGAVVQYRIGRLGGYLFAAEDPEALIRLAVETALTEALAASRVDDVLTSAKGAIQTRVRGDAQARLDLYGAGVALVAVNLQSVEPPAEASRAFRAVADARAEAAEAVSRSEGERGRALRLARGEAEQLLGRARTDADRRVQQARGAAERFEVLLRQQRLAPDQARLDLRRDALRRILPRTRVIVLAPGETPRIGVQLIDGPSAGESPLPPDAPQGVGGH